MGTICGGTEYRRYPANKITENITAEIMITCLLETREAYAEEIVVELKSDGTDGAGDVEENVRRIAEWVQQWREDQLADNDEEG